MNRWSVRRLLPHVLMVAALAGIVTYGSHPARDGAQPERHLAATPCRLDHGVCRVQPDAQASIALTVAPRPVPAGTPFLATAVVEGLTARTVELEFEGTDMNMGLFRQSLSARSSGTFESNVTLPLCATGAMRWQARLIVRTESETLVVPFNLTTGHERHAMLQPARRAAAPISPSPANISAQVPGSGTAATSSVTDMP